MAAINAPAEETQETTRTQKLLKWGTGLFENDADAQIIRELTKELIPGKKGVLSILYLQNAQALETRKKLDAGALNRLLKRYLPVDGATVLADQDKKDTIWIWPPKRSLGYRLCLLGAAVMRLGCVVRSDFRQSLEELHVKVGFSHNAQVQLRHALNVYLDGTPCSLYDKPRPVGLDQDDFAGDGIWDDISESLFDMGGNPEPALRMATRLALGPMLKCAAAGDNEHPQNACGNCGKKKAVDGSPCRPCSDCGQRLYCSRKYELAHRPKHLLICKDPLYRIMGNILAKAKVDNNNDG